MVELAENKATQPSLAGAWAELGNSICKKYEKNRTQPVFSEVFLHDENNVVQI